MSREWVFLETSKKGHLLSAGRHQYPFEIGMPGNLPETIENSSYCQVLYKLKAIGARPNAFAFFNNFTDRQTIRVLRQIYPPASFSVDYSPVRVAERYNHVLRYEALVHKKMFRRGERVDVDLYLVPEEAWRVRHISGVFKEYTVFTVDGANNATPEPRIIRFFRDDHVSSSSWHTTESFVIPRYAQCDATNPFFTIHHKLQLTVSLVNTHDPSLIKDLRTALPIGIAHDIVMDAQENETIIIDDDDALPTYEDARRCTNYAPALTFSSESSPIQSTVNTPVDELDDWLSLPRQNLPLCRLPSYRTAMATTTTTPEITLLPDI